MGVKSVATKGSKSVEKKEGESKLRTGEEEDVNVPMGSVDRRDEGIEKKNKKRKKKKKEGGDRGDESVEGEEERPEKQDGGKKGKEGGEDLVKGVETSSEKVRDEEDRDGEVGGDVVGSESGHRGQESVDDKRNKKKKRKREFVVDDSEEKVEASEGEREESKKKKKKIEKKRNGENGPDGVEDETRIDEEGIGGKTIKETESESGSVSAEGKVETNEERGRSNKKKKKMRSEDVSDSMEDKAVGSEERDGEKNKKKKTRSEDASDGTEDKAMSSEEGDREKKKKKKKTRSGDVSDGTEYKAVSSEEGYGEKKKKKKKTRSEDVSDGTEYKAVSSEEGDGEKKKKKKTSEDVSDGTEAKAVISEEGDGEKKKKKKKKNKKLKRKSVSGGAEVGAEMYEETGKSKKTEKTKSESVSDGVGGKAKKKRKSEDICSAVEEDEGENEDHRKDNKKKAKKGKGEEGKARTENSAETSGASENPTPKSSKRVSFSDDVEVFDVGPSKVAKSWKCRKEDGLVQGKRFTPEEDEMVKDAVLKYIEEHNLGDDGLEMVLNCRSHKEVRHCWKEISKALPQRPLSSVYYRAHILFERADTRTWTDEERAYVQEFYSKHGADWKQLATELKKHRFHCKDTWRRNKLLNRNKGRWKQEEYQGLFDLVNKDLHMRALEEDRDSKHGMLRDNICWQAISDKLATRNVSTCCTKWYKQLTSPMVEEGFWSDTDDYRLIDALSVLDAPCLADVDWDSLLEHRDGNTSLKRWNQMVKHIGDYAKLSFSEQVELLAERYSPDCLEAREEFDSKPVVNGDGVRVDDSNLNEAVKSCP